MAELSGTFGYDDAYQILRLIEANKELRSVEITVGDFSISVERQDDASAQSAPHSATPMAVVERTPDPASSRPPGGAQQSLAGVSRPDALRGQEDVLTTMAGVFYRAPSPGAEPFVEVGSHIEAGDTIGIIEVMKLMSTVSSSVAGTITEIFVSNGDLVQFDQALVRVQLDDDSREG